MGSGVPRPKRALPSGLSRVNQAGLFSSWCHRPVLGSFSATSASWKSTLFSFRTAYPALLLLQKCLQSSKLLLLAYACKRAHWALRQFHSSYCFKQGSSQAVRSY